MKPSFFAYRSFWPNPETVAAFGRIGIDTVCIYPAHTLSSLGIPYSKYPPTWAGPGLYDFDSLDQQIADVADANPDAKILCMIDLNSPHWWVRHFQLPDLGLGSTVEDPFYGLGKVAPSEKWRRDTTEYLHAFLHHAEERHRDRMAGYILACGGTCEWLDRSGGMESASRRAAWRKWMIAQGHPDPIDIPPQSIREHATHDLLRDPQADRLGMLYWRFAQEVIGDAIGYFAAQTQQLLRHRVPLGIFYGYILELAQNRLLSEGHLDYDRVFANPDLDFFIAPGTYLDRGNGGAGGVMLCTGTAQRYGKGYLHEIDHRTHTANLQPQGPNRPQLFPCNPFQDVRQSVAGLKREFSFSLIERTSLWWFDMFGGYYDDPEVLAAIQCAAGIWDEMSGRPENRAVEVALIADPRSALYLDQADPRIDKLYFNLRPEVARMGATFRWFSTSDIAHIDWSDYKMVVFPALYCVDEALRRQLAERICTDGRTVVWVDRPGVIDGERYNLDNVAALTGLSPTQTLQTADMNGWVSVLSPLGGLSRSVLRNLAAQAGVHIYSESEEPLFADGDLLALHSATGGRRKLHLPRPARAVRELFTGRTVAEAADSFEDTLTAPDTVLYRLLW